MAKSLLFRRTLCVLLAVVKLNMAQQNPFYGNQTPPPYNDQTPDYRRPDDQNNSNSYDSNNRYDPNNRYNSDPNNRYDSNNRYNSDPNNRYDQNNRYDPSNRYNDPYNRNNDTNYRNNDQYYRYNDSNRYNDPQNRYNDPQNRYNDPQNRYNQSGNRYNDPNNRYNDSGNRYNDPYNRNNESGGRYNDPHNRYNESGNRYNDPNSRYNESGNRYNDPYNRNNDPNSRYNQDQYNRYNTTNNYNLGSDLNPNYRQNNDPYNRYNVSGGNYNQESIRYNQYDPNNRYNQQNQYNNQNRNNNPFNQGRPDYGQRNDQQSRQYESTSSGQQYGYQADPNDNCCEEYCYRTDENPSLWFGSKTAYQIVYGRKPNQDVPECTPVLMWSINRQGTSAPTQQEIRRLRNLENIRMEILRNYDERRSYPYKGKLCNQDLDLLRRWRWNDTINENREKVLSTQGIEDAKFLARRFKSKYPSLLNQIYKDNYYNFQYDTSTRTHETYQSYIEGLFDLSKSFNVRANTELSERVLPPNQCKTVMREVEENSYTFSEYERFKKRPDYLQMVRDVFKRLGFRYTGGDDVIRNMYDMCRYEKAWYLADPSPWCSVFNKKQLELLEYAEDLQDYYYSGYGNPANAKVGCLLVKDMYGMMRKVVNGEPADAYKVSHYFTHSTQFLRFLTALGIAKDYTPLTADNYYQQKSRQWKLSLIDPFGANLVAVLYHCQRENKYKVMFLLNEVPVNFPDCSVGLCDWSTVEQKYRSVVENCNSDYCEHGAAGKISSAFVPLLISTISLLFLSRRMF